MLAQFAVYDYQGRDKTVRKWNNLTARLLEVFRSAAEGSSVIGIMFRWTDLTATAAIVGVSRELGLRTVVFGGDSEGDIPRGISQLIGHEYVAGQVVQRDPEGMRNHNKVFLFEAVRWERLNQLGLVLPTSPMPPSPGPAIWISSSNLTDADHTKCNQAVLLPLSDSARARIAPYLFELAAGYSNEGHKRDHYRVVSDTAPGPARDLQGSSIAFGEQPTLADTPVQALTDAVPGAPPVVTKVPISPPASPEQAPPAKSGSALYQFFPHRGSSNDPIVEVLRRIKHYEGTASGRCDIRIATPRWHDDRIAIAQCLQRLVANGATVEVICRRPDDRYVDGSLELGPNVLSILKQCTTRYYQKKGVNIHSKYLLIDAPYSEQTGVHDYAPAKLVLTGTANFTGPAISSNWETLVLLRDYPGAYDAFLMDFQSLPREGSAIGPVTPPN